MIRTILCFTLIWYSFLHGYDNQPHRYVFDTFVGGKAAAQVAELTAEEWYARQLDGVDNEIADLGEGATDAERRRLNLKKRLIELAWSSMQLPFASIASAAGGFDSVTNPRNDQGYGETERFIGALDALVELLYRRQKKVPTSRERRLARLALIGAEYAAAHKRHGYTSSLDRSIGGVRRATFFQRLSQLAHFWLLHNTEESTLRGQWQHFKSISKWGKLSLLLKLINLLLLTIKSPSWGKDHWWYLRKKKGWRQLSPEERAQRPRVHELKHTIKLMHKLVGVGRAQSKNSEDITSVSMSGRLAQTAGAAVTAALDIARVDHDRTEIGDEQRHCESVARNAREIAPAMSWLSQQDDNIVRHILEYL